MAALVAAPSAAAAPVPSDRSWTKRSQSAPLDASAARAATTAADSSPLLNSAIAFLVLAVTRLRLQIVVVLMLVVRLQTRNKDYEGRRESHRISKQWLAARTDRHQSVLVALSPARQLGLQVARQVLAQGID